MDPFAHTLVGATMAETGLGRTSRLATATLVIGANLPDIDVLAGVLGSDASLYFRRGITHGIVAMVLLPLALAAAMIAYDRWRTKHQPELEPARFAPLVALSFLAVLSHPALDWLNTYGVRLLYPFSGRWFYGDSLFIVDPWMWLLMAGAVVLARSKGRLSQSAWIILASASTALVTTLDFVPFPAKLLWLGAVALIIVTRILGRAQKRTEVLARTMLGALLVYIGLMVAGTALARHQAGNWLAAQGVETTRIMAGPLPANPFIRDIVAVTPDGYRFLSLDWLSDQRFASSHPPLSGDVRDPIIEAALNSPSVRGFRTWMRFPTYEIGKHDRGYRVTIRDVRYSRFDALIGTEVVELDEGLQPR